MGLFFPKKPDREVAGIVLETQRPAYIRIPLLILLLGFVIVLYWQTFSNKLSDLEAETFFKDETGVWSVEDKRRLFDQVALFHEQWGMRVLVQVSLASPLLPELTGNTLFIGVSANNQETLIVLPNLAAGVYRDLSRQVGYDLQRALQEDLALCMKARGNSTQCIHDTLDSIGTTLNTY